MPCGERKKSAPQSEGLLFVSSDFNVYNFIYKIITVCYNCNTNKAYRCN